MSRLYASDLPQDKRWPYFVRAHGLDALLAMIAGAAEFSRDAVFDALTKPERRYTNNAKRLYWEKPDDTMMVRLTNGERHALLTMVHGVAFEALRTSEEVQGLNLHLRHKAKLLRRHLRESA